jgi:hypothetical protein
MAMDDLDLDGFMPQMSQSMPFEFPTLEGPANHESYLHHDQLSKWINKERNSEYINPVSENSDPDSPYKPLTRDFEIRVLEILPGLHNSVIECVFHRCSLKYQYEAIENWRKYTKHGLSTKTLKPIWYCALSYTWGAPVFDAQIICNGRSLKITTGLAQALQHFRKKDQSIVMWIDQICIDQNNQKEKEKQIPLMSLIYQRAFFTVVWLGEGIKTSSKVLDLLRDIKIKFQFAQGSIDPEDLQSLLLPKASESIWQDLKLFFENPYFKRLWIIQEIILSLDIWIAWGNATISWKEFELACTNIVENGFSQWIGMATNGKSIYDLSILRDYYNTVVGGLSLTNTLVNTRYAQCHYGHDKIFGILGVCANFGIKIDYSQPINKLYTDIAILCLKEGSEKHTRIDDRGIFTITTAHTPFKTLCCIDREKEMSSSLPSWVPDWTKPRKTVSLGFSTQTIHIYNSSRKRQSDIILPLPGRNELSIAGIKFDMIADLTSTFVDTGLELLDPEKPHQVLLSAIDLAEKCSPYHSSLNTFTALCNTLVGGKDDSGIQKCPPGPEGYAEIFSLVFDIVKGGSPKNPMMSDQTYSLRQLLPPGRGRLELKDLHGKRGPARVYKEIVTAVDNAFMNRKVGRATKGLLGLFPDRTRIGDEIVLFLGAHVPFVVRGLGNGMFQLIGECYVYGVMDGEVLDMNIDQERIILV